MRLNPRESGKLVSSLANHVQIKNVQKLGDVLIEEVKSGRITTNNFSQNEVHPSPDSPNVLDWLFVVDTLNFCFWHRENDEGWKVDGYTGYFALCAAVNRAIKENIDILNPKYYSTITEHDLKKILRSDTGVDCPLLPERVKCLHEVGAVLLENFKGTFENVVKRAENSAVKLLKLIVDNFKCFQDEATYKGHEISVYKRAQILVGDIWACFKNENLGKFDDIDEITMFADYRVPQTLLWFGVLEYDEKLLEKLKNDVILENGSEEEVEIRCCSIHAVEKLTEYVNQKMAPNKVNSVLIDHFLWHFRRKNNAEIVKKGLPFHKTFSIYY